MPKQAMAGSGCLQAVCSAMVARRQRCCNSWHQDGPSLLPVSHTAQGVGAVVQTFLLDIIGALITTEPGCGPFTGLLMVWWRCRRLCWTCPARSLWARCRRLWSSSWAS